jgi:putative copper export protein
VREDAFESKHSASSREGNKELRNITATQKGTWIAWLRSHDRQAKLDYRFRSKVLIVAALIMVIGAVMVFAGLHGSVEWAVEAPHTISAKLTNASPGIIFATIGMILIFAVVMQKPSQVPKLAELADAQDLG